MKPLRLLQLLSALVSAAAPLCAQGAGFTPLDLYHYGFTTLSPTASGIARVDPISGATTLTTSLLVTRDQPNAMAFDPYRQRLVFVARQLPDAPSPWYHAYMSDGFGNLTPITPGASDIWDGIAPTGDGRIYFRNGLSGSGGNIFWLDAANQQHVLYDTDGITPLVLDPTNQSIAGMIWHPAHNALFTASASGVAVCSGGDPKTMHVRKLVLSADGTRLASPPQCAEFDVNPGDLDVCLGWGGPLPDGDLLLGAHSGVYGPPQQPRLLRVNPLTLAITPFAWFGDNSNGGTAFSTALNRGIAQSHFQSRLLAYSDGQVDNGVGVGAAVFPGTSNSVCEIPLLSCDGGWIAYGGGLPGAGGKVPRLYGQGCDEPGQVIGIRMDQVVGGAPGALFVGLASAAAPFKGGTLHAGALFLTISIAVGGAPGAPGAGSLTLPAALPGSPGLSGVSVFMQAAFQDLSAVQKVSLSQGLEMEIG